MLLYFVSSLSSKTDWNQKEPHPNVENTSHYDIPVIHISQILMHSQKNAYYQHYWNHFAVTEETFESETFRQWIGSRTLHATGIKKVYIELDEGKPLPEYLTLQLQTLIALNLPEEYSNPAEAAIQIDIIVSYIVESLNLPEPLIEEENLFFKVRDRNYIGGLRIAYEKDRPHDRRRGY